MPEGPIVYGYMERTRRFLKDVEIDDGVVRVKSLHTMYRSDGSYARDCELVCLPGCCGRHRFDTTEYVNRHSCIVEKDMEYSVTAKGKKMFLKLDNTTYTFSFGLYGFIITSLKVDQLAKYKQSSKHKFAGKDFSPLDHPYVHNVLVLADGLRFVIWFVFCDVFLDVVPFDVVLPFVLQIGPGRLHFTSGPVWMRDHGHQGFRRPA